jgi:hypothetical protein
MTNDQWHNFFRICAKVLGPGARRAAQSKSWCAWTTFGSLSDSVHYWAAGLPAEEDLAEVGTADRGAWGQPFLYKDLAHIIIPREFYWEIVAPGQFENGTRQQDIAALSAALNSAGIRHRLTELVLEIKLY